MMNGEKGVCPVCGYEEALLYRNALVSSVFVECDCCGKFDINDTVFDFKSINMDMLASYLYYCGKLKLGIEVKDERFYHFIENESKFESEYSKYPFCRLVTKDIVENWYPKTFSEKVDLFLLGLSKKSEFIGEPIILTSNQLRSACFVLRNPKGPMSSLTNVIEIQTQYFLDYMANQKYISYDGCTLTILPDGLKRIDELQKSDANNKNIFVSMAFNEQTKKTREAIRNGVIESGFSPEFIDEIIHNHQIMPEMFRLIRESKMLVLDISDPNFGAYYEAGYALGFGKEVIICCNQKVFNKEIEIDGKQISDEDMSKFGKYLLPHFDIAQKQILIWNDYDDLTIKLAEWIKALS